MQFISTSATSRATWTTLENTYASPSRSRIMNHRQNLGNPQQGNRTIIDYMQDVKRNIDSLTLMNVSIDFDELSIRVLDGLGLTYSNISHALQARDTSFTFDELFEHLLSYEAQLQILGSFRTSRLYSGLYLHYFDWPFIPSSVQQPWWTDP